MVPGARLANQVAVVTCASGGLGRRIAAALAREGAAVVVHSWPHAGAGAQVVEEIEAGGGRAKGVGGDLSRPEDAAAVVAAAGETFGRLDVLVNNTGLARDTPILMMPDEDWYAVLETSLSGAFYCIRAALREFVRQRRGRIISVARPAGPTGATGQATHIAAKAGIIGLTRAVAREVGSRGITANVVVPGLIVDPDEPVPPEMVARALGRVPLGRTGSSDDVAAAVAFLASDEAGYITGQVLHIDGGMVMH